MFSFSCAFHPGLEAAPRIEAEAQCSFHLEDVLDGVHDEEGCATGDEKDMVVDIEVDDVDIEDLDDEGSVDLVAEDGHNMQG